MTEFQVLFTKQAEKEFLSLPKTLQKALKEKLDFLALHAEISGSLKSFRKIIGTKNGYRIRVDRYRILYLLFLKKREIWICTIFLKKKPKNYANLITQVIQRGVAWYD